jgi:hypothetical protein
MTVLEPHDDLPHPIGPEPNFNESMYFHFHDRAHRIGGFLRLANRPNEGSGERTVCLYLPGGDVAFGFVRPAFADNARFRAGGLSVDVMTPFQNLELRFEGRVNLLSEPAAMVNPKAALSTSPVAECQADLRFTAAAPPLAETFDGDGESFAPNHYEQLMYVSGGLRVGAASFDVSGYGLRDHSWGPRSWQAPWFYRWVHGSTEGFGFMAAYFGSPDNARPPGRIRLGRRHSARVRRRHRVDKSGRRSTAKHDRPGIEVWTAAVVLPRRGRRFRTAAASQRRRREHDTHRRVGDHLDRR